MQTWDYLVLYQTRLPAGWLSGPYKYVQWEPDFDIKKLGEEGWELVNIVPASGVSAKAAVGFTTELMWVFKRPKEK